MEDANGTPGNKPGARIDAIASDYGSQLEGIMISIEEALVVSQERITDCGGEIAVEFTDLIAKGEESGFTRKEVLVAISALTACELSSLPDVPRIH
ncbi:hypothetical protein [Rhizobium sp. Rhizsp42]|uniref:hypothetical protein n=1 Tax=Rhizobium sp. Rhizsp42 TaxID=3243034 RepID=UPI0039B0CD47